MMTSRNRDSLKKPSEMCRWSGGLGKMVFRIRERNGKSAWIHVKHSKTARSDVSKRRLRASLVYIWYPKQQVFWWMLGLTTIFYVQIWFIIQVKQPFINGCFRFQVCTLCPLAFENCHKGRGFQPGFPQKNDIDDAKYAGIFQVCKFVPFHPKNLPKGRTYIYLEDPGIYAQVGRVWNGGP